MLPKFEWNWLEFCGSKTFKIWVDSYQDLTHCFQLLCLQIPILSIIAIISAFYVGHYTECFIRTSREKRVLKFRIGVVLLLACIPAAQIIILVYNDSKSLFVIDYAFAVLASFSWFVHLCYVSALRSGTCSSLRGPVKLNSLWIMLFIACIIHTRSVILKYIQEKTMETQVSLSFAVVATVLHVMYGFSLIFGDDSSSRRSTLEIFDQVKLLRL